MKEFESLGHESWHASPGYEALMDFGDEDVYEMPESFEPNPSYERYLRMHKVVVGQRGSEQLVDIHESLRDERMPRYLAAAGSAGVEAALIQDYKPVEDRLELLESGVDCWKRAIKVQRACNNSEKPYVTEHEAPYRLAMDIATAPLIEGIIEGDVTSDCAEGVFEDCLNIAQQNAVRINLMDREGDVEGVGHHIGIGYECNALLAFNQQLSETWFMIPSMVRSDTGYHHPQQTHDLLVVHQKWGEVQSMTPVEIKSAANSRDRARYKALLIRGKLHLSVDGRCAPEHTLNAITAVYEGTATTEEEADVTLIVERMKSMIRDYYAGEELGELATARSVTKFHDNSLVAAHFPGLLPKAG